MSDAGPAAHLPGNKKQQRVFLIVGAGAAAFVVWRYYKASQTPSAPPADSAVDDGSVTDVPAGTGVAGGNVQYAGSVQPGDASITTNSAWTQAAVDYLSNTAGYGAAAVVDALGNYLAGNGLTDAQITIVRAALAAAGPPPQGGPYTIRHAVSQTAPDPKAQTPTAPHPLTVTQHNTGGIRVEWPYVAGATSYQGSFDGQYWYDLGGKNAFGGGTARPGGPKFAKGQHVRVMVRAVNSHGRSPIADVVVTIE